MSIATGSVLFVDDEQSILNSLKRLLRPTGFKIHVANSAAAGLALMTDQEVDVVVSDMRMPEMDGAEFLMNVATKWPQTTRLLLTGYADLNSAISAINSGEISRYLTKPWQDEDLVMSIRTAMQNHYLAKEKERLEALASRQNDELRQLNQELEQKVAVRTQEIQKASEQLSTAYEELQSSYSAAVEMFSRLIQARVGLGSRDIVAQDAREIGSRMGLDEEQCEALYQAALLCDIGKVTLPDESIRTAYLDLDALAQREYHKHPVAAFETLRCLKPLEKAAEVVRQHCERYDGTGFPDKIDGSKVMLSARILAVCKAYPDLQSGCIVEEPLTPADSRKYLQDEGGRRYDPEVVVRFLEWLGSPKRKTGVRGELKLDVQSLRAGMKLSRDFLNPSGMLVLAKFSILSAAHIKVFTNLQQDQEEELVFYVLGNR